MPCEVKVTEAHDGLEIEFRFPFRDDSGFFSSIEVILLTQLLSNAIGMKLPILALKYPCASPDMRKQIDDYLGVNSQPFDNIILKISRDVAELSLVPFKGHLQDVVLSFEDEVKLAIKKHLPSGRAHIDIVASDLNKSKRSLQRQLKENGTHFQALLTEVRKELATQYFQNDQLSLPEISYLLGYSEPSAFSRAYKQWTGLSPTTYRSVNQV